MHYGLSSLPSRASLPPPPTALEAAFTIEVDVARNLVRYTLAGFFNAASIQAFAVGQAQALRRLRCGPNRHVTILDIAGCKIQSRETMAQFGAMLDDPRHRGRALAVVTGGSLARSQVARLLTRPELAYFAVAADAEAWLFARDPAGSAAADRIGD